MALDKVQATFTAWQERIIQTAPELFSLTRTLLGHSDTATAMFHGEFPVVEQNEHPHGYFLTPEDIKAILSEGLDRRPISNTDGSEGTLMQLARQDLIADLEAAGRFRARISTLSPLLLKYT